MPVLRDALVRLALALSLALPLYFLGAALATRYHFVDWRTGFDLLTMQIGPWLVLGATGLATLGLLVSLIVRPTRGVMAALAALIVPALIIGYAARHGAALSGSIMHDVSTDASERPSFSEATAALRAERQQGALARLPFLLDALGFDRESGAQTIMPPGIRPVITSLSRDAAFEAALNAARAQGWRVRELDRAHGKFFAEAESLWYGAIDDIVVRVRSNPPGAIVDVRAAARVRAADSGGNPERVRAFIADLKERLARS